MAETVTKIGIISCSGEEIPEGTVARQAVRRVLEALRPQQTVTLCLPLFLAGEEGERRFAREHPTITVDGCSKLCAKRGTEKFSGKVSVSLVVSDILGDKTKGCHCSTRNADKADEEAVWIVAERIASKVDALVDTKVQDKPNTLPIAGSTGCACGGPPSDGKLTINGESVTIHGLPLIFDHLKKKGLRPGNGCGDTLLQSVKVYHPIESIQEDGYRDALVGAYEAYCGQNRD
jgi:uncharacterized metal-binding protein